jgi:hypothetical protein
MADWFALLGVLVGAMLVLLLFAGQAKATDKLRFCLLDVLGGTSRRTTFAMLLTVLGVCLLAVVAFGLFKGAEDVQIRRIEQQPLALRLRAGRRHSHFKSSFLLEKVKPELERIFGDQLIKFSPFRVRELRVRLQPETTASSLVSRTVHLDDGQRIEDSELIRHIPLKRVENRQDTESEGVILCPQFLRKLAIRKNSIPEKIYLDLEGQAAGTKTIAVDVLGVLRQDLPENVDVLYSEELENALFYPPTRKPASQMRLSGFPVDWDQEARDKVKDYMENRDYQSQPPHWMRPKILDDSTYWELWVNSQQPQDFETFWALEKDNLEHFVNESFSTDAVVQLSIQNLPAVEVSGPVPTTYTYLGLYFAEPLALPLAADYLETLSQFQNRAVDRGQADQVASVRKLSAAHLKVLDVFRVIVALFAFLNLWIIQVLRAQQKSVEAGMLKALGMNHVDMCGIVCFESLLVWAFGALVGILSGEIVGRVLSNLLYGENLARFGFASNWQEWSLLLCVTAVITLLSAVFGTLRWFRAPPGELMQD